MNIHPKFPEIEQIEKITNRFQRLGVNFERSVLTSVEFKGYDYPVYGFTFGSNDKTLPTFGLFGGVHGLEKIGTHLILNYLNSLSYRMTMNDLVRKAFDSVRFVSIPMINPVGVKHNRRGNAKRVDLMRNGPVEAEGKTIPFASGHRFSPNIWWYRGEEGVLEPESQALIDFVREQMFESEFSMALDVHSGFGMKDRLWYPYSKTNEPFPLQRRAQDFKRLMKLINPFHIYQVETQSEAYLINGDLWDHLFDLHHFDPRYQGTFLPWTLEMGSWSWVRKNPFQLLKSTGLFHPIKPHRVKRTMRRHWWLLDFFTNSIANYENWAIKGV